MQIQGSTFLITGGASGLGAACAHRFARMGGRVVIADLNQELGERVAAQWDCCLYVHTDVTNEGQVENAVQSCLTEFGGLQGVLNCAGVAIAMKVVGSRGVHPLDQFQNVINVNLNGSFNVVRLASQVMARSEPMVSGERGVIINTASVAAYEGQIGQAAYAASKGGIVALTLPLARELAAHGIRVVTIAPGIFRTPMLAGLPEKAQESLAQQVPFPARLGEPEEYASLAQHIVENPMLNGEVIRLDGAIRMSPR